jgi:hypothetical protein
MRRIKLFEEFIEYIAPKKKKIKDISKRVVIIPGWDTY